IYFSTPYDSCHQAHPLCGDTVFVFTQPGNSPAVVGECCPGDIWPQCCRSWGCLPGHIITPRWFFIRVATPGKIEMLVSVLKYLVTPGVWVTFCPDFLVYGPFYDPTSVCVAGLTDSTVVDCHIYNYGPDTINIPWGNTGEFYLINITAITWSYNYPFYYKFFLLHSGEPGYGSLDCNMMIYCSILSLTAQPSDCDPTNNTFTLSGKVYFVHPPQTGNLVVWDNNTGYSTVISGPFESPVNYSIPGIPCDNALHTVTAMFWDSASCNLSVQYQAPVLCPDAVLSGGGSLCEGSGVSVPLSVQISPWVQTPVTLRWKINGVPQPSVTTPGPFPYIIQATQGGIYVLDTVYNALCAGQIQGQATVMVNPTPQPNLGPDITTCEGREVELDAGGGFASYKWNTGDNTRFLTVNKSGEYYVMVTNSQGCVGSDTIQVNFMNKPLPLLIKHH
ncbi:MAG: hypothetical protein ACP5O2_03840, partial [Bacteroidales bacterium]